MKLNKSVKRIQRDIQEFCNNNYSFVSLGETCTSAWYIKECGLRTGAYPFDWVFSSPEIVIDCIEDDFECFLDKKYMEKSNGAGHFRYHSRFFKHKNPYTIDKNYTYYNRCVKRFIELINSDKKVVYVITLMNDLRDVTSLGWRRGFNHEFDLPVDQKITDIQPLIDMLYDKNNNSKFIIIDFLKNKKRKIVYKIDGNVLSIMYEHVGIRGLAFADKHDDEYFKKIFVSIRG